MDESYFFRTEFVRTALEMPTDQRKSNYVAILRREFKTHVELVFEHFAVKAERKRKLIQFEAKKKTKKKRYKKKKRKKFF